MSATPSVSGQGSGPVEAPVASQSSVVSTKSGSDSAGAGSATNSISNQTPQPTRQERLQQAQDALKVAEGTVAQARQAVMASCDRVLSANSDWGKQFVVVHDEAEDTYSVQIAEGETNYVLNENGTVSDNRAFKFGGHANDAYEIAVGQLNDKVETLTAAREAVLQCEAQVKALESTTLSTKDSANASQNNAGAEEEGWITWLYMAPIRLVGNFFSLCYEYLCCCFASSEGAEEAAGDTKGNKSEEASA